MDKLLAEMDQEEEEEPEEVEEKPKKESKSKRGKKDKAEAVDARDQIGGGDDDGPVFFDMEEERIRKRELEEQRNGYPLKFLYPSIF